MNKYAMAVAMGMMLAGVASAETQEGDRKASPEVLAACQAVEERASDVAECIPFMDAAIVALEAFDEVYGQAAAPLKDTCMELNTGNSEGAWTCIKKEIEGAISIAGMLPEGQGLDDPMLDAVRVQDDYERIEEARREVLAGYPDNRGRGVTSYMPYKKLDASSRFAQAQGISQAEACKLEQDQETEVMEALLSGAGFMGAVAISMQYDGLKDNLPEYTKVDFNDYRHNLPAELQSKMDSAEGIALMNILAEATNDEKKAIRESSKRLAEDNYQRCLEAAE